MGLILVGVVHRDPLGYHTLRRLLESLRPGALCLELSPLGLLWREQQGPVLLSRLDRLTGSLPPAKRGHHQLELIRDALAFPFEYRACRAHAREKGISLHLIDLNWVSGENLPMYESEILTASNLDALVVGPDRPVGLAVQRAYAQARRCLIRGLSPGDKEGGTWNDEETRRRERFMACRLRKIVDRGTAVVHVGGWVHLMNDGEGRSLAALLRDLSPRRILLDGLELDPLPS